MRMRSLATVLTAAILLFGCERGDQPLDQAGSMPEEMLLYCGAGLRPVAEALIEAFEAGHDVKIVADYAGSEVLLSKIRLVRKGDLYMPGDKHYVDQAAADEMILSQTSVCYFVPTILVQKGNPRQLEDLSDLTRPGLKIGLGDPQACAIGRKTQQIFEKNSIAPEAIEKNVAFQSLTVNELGLQIQARALDAVIVWDAIADYYRDSATEVRIVPERNVISTVDVGVLTFSSNRSLAEQFVQFAASEQGKAIFREHGYTVEYPE